MGWPSPFVPSLAAKPRRREALVRLAALIFANYAPTPSSRQACARRVAATLFDDVAMPYVRRRAGRSSMAWMDRAAAALSGIFFLASGGTRTRS